MRWLSSLCDDVFHGAPQISNELVNRHILSSAAAAARMRLIELMFAHADKPDLGLPPDRKPPEKSMYLSVLHSTGIHSAQDGKWQFCYPAANQLAKVRPALDRIRQLILGRPDSRVSVDEIHTHLQAPPFGLRDGLFPLFLAVVIIVEERGIALYENGTFVRDVGPTTFLRMTKAPERFEVQYCKIEGVRTEVFERLLAIVDVQSVEGRDVELLDVVKTLCVFVAQLPAYVLNTQRLSPIAISVRNAILNAREPVKLVFSDLPEACGFDPIVTHAGGGEVGLEFVKSLRSALDDLRNAYPDMQERMRAQLRGEFDLPGTFQQFRRALATRAEQILPGVAEPKLRAFCLRLLDDNLPEADWLESIGAFLALKPPAKWHDAEEDLFNNDLAVWGNRFHKVESIVFTAGNLPLNSVGIHLSVTQANGVAHERVIRYSTEEEQRMSEIQRQFERLLSEGGHLGLAAASRAILNRFEKTEPANS